MVIPYIRGSDNICMVVSCPCSLCPWLCRLWSLVRALVYIISLLTKSTPLSRQANMPVHNHFTCIQAAPWPPLPRITPAEADTHPTQVRQSTFSTVLGLVPALSMSQISQDAAPGRCHRSPALRALGLLAAIDGAGGCTYAL